MKDRVLKLWRECEDWDYFEVWQKPDIYKEEIERNGSCHEWNYYKWAGADIHHNIQTDEIVVFCDAKRWDE